MPEFRSHSYAAFLSDMDGTLLDSSAVVERVWRTWAQQHGVDVDALMANMHGVRSEDTIRRFAKPTTDIARETDWILQAELGDVEGVVPLEDIHAFIDRLQRGKGRRRGCGDCWRTGFWDRRSIRPR